MTRAASRSRQCSTVAVVGGGLLLDTRTNQLSQRSQAIVAGTRDAVPDERSALETEITRLQGDVATYEYAPKYERRGKEENWAVMGLELLWAVCGF